MKSLIDNTYIEKQLNQRPKFNGTVDRTIIDLSLWLSKTRVAIKQAVREGTGTGSVAVDIFIRHCLSGIASQVARGWEVEHGKKFYEEHANDYIPVDKLIEYLEEFYRKDPKIAAQQALAWQRFPPLSEYQPIDPEPGVNKLVYYVVDGREVFNQCALRHPYPDEASKDRVFNNDLMARLPEDVLMHVAHREPNYESLGFLQMQQLLYKLLADSPALFGSPKTQGSINTTGSSCGNNGQDGWQRVGPKGCLRHGDRASHCTEECRWIEARIAEDKQRSGFGNNGNGRGGFGNQDGNGGANGGNGSANGGNGAQRGGFGGGHNRGGGRGGRGGYNNGRGNNQHGGKWPKNKGQHRDDSLANKCLRCGLAHHRVAYCRVTPEMARTTFLRVHGGPPGVEWDNPAYAKNCARCSYRHALARCKVTPADIQADHRVVINAVQGQICAMMAVLPSKEDFPPLTIQTDVMQDVPSIPEPTTVVPVTPSPAPTRTLVGQVTAAASAVLNSMAEVVTNPTLDELRLQYEKLCLSAKGDDCPASARL